MESVNKLSRAETERLALIISACSAVNHACSQIIRHGYESANDNPGNVLMTNRECFEIKVGELQYLIDYMVANKDIDREKVIQAALAKGVRLPFWTHHQKESQAVNSEIPYHKVD